MDKKNALLEIVLDPDMHIYIDTTDTYSSGRNTGIQRVVRSFFRHLSSIGPSQQFLCTAVVFKHGGIHSLEGVDDFSVHVPRTSFRDSLNSIYSSATQWLATMLPFSPFQRFLRAHRSQFGLAWLLYLPMHLVGWLRPRANKFEDLPPGIEDTLGADDIIFLPDASWSVDIFEILKKVKSNGTRIVFFIHDIIPITHPEVCHPVHVERFEKWFLQTMQIADFLICNSRFTQECLADYLAQHSNVRHLDSAVVHLGYDLGTVPSGGIRHRKLRTVLMNSRPSFICVGTLEPRKNLAVLIDAFELLWRDGSEASLVLIGREGWLCDDLLNRIRQHPQKERFLFWFNDVRDADLALAYRQASALIFPSIVEGFGLPLVEALSQGLPVIASDIPVFREIAANSARYFQTESPHDLAVAIKGHLAMSSNGRAPSFKWPTWEESTRLLITNLKSFSVGRPAQDGTQVF